MPARTSAASGLVVGFLALVLIGWGAGEAWLSVVGSAELDAMREVVAARTDALTALARVVTWAGSALLLVPLALTCSFALARAGRRREALLVVLGLAGAILLVDLVKPLVSRPRPPVEHLQKVAGSSFPSGHATQASAFWLSLVIVVRSAGGSRLARSLAAVAALVIVATVAASRVYLGVHYPADVIAGVLLGGAWAAWVWRCVKNAH